MDETNPEFAELERFLSLCQFKHNLLENYRSILYRNEPLSRQTFQLVFMKLHNLTENSLDRMLLSYIGSQDLKEETMLALFAEQTPRGLLNSLVFNFGFDNKLNLICEAFPTISESTKQILKTINKIRNGLAHRYKDDHAYFLFKKMNVITNVKALTELMVSFSSAMEEIDRVEAALEEYID